MHRTVVLCLFAGALGVAATASAQPIEISSQSIGTVVVTPPPINPTGPRPAAARAGRGNGNGVDLGIRRNRDGSLYDPLDRGQNPAAAPTSDLAAANAQSNPQPNGNGVPALPSPTPEAGGFAR